MANDAKTKEYYSGLKKRSLAVCGLILGNKEGEELEVIDRELMDLFVPKKFDGSDGVEVQGINKFHDTCTVMSQYINKDPKKMTVVEFYRTLINLKRQLKPSNKKKNKHGSI